MLNPDLVVAIEEGKRLTGHQHEIHDELLKNPRTIVILDDDPTGTQTVHNIPVITQWDEEVLEKELLSSPVFFILTNSRSLQVDEANALANLLGNRLQKLSEKNNKNLMLISRSDSTLRGHYPNEVDALIEGLGWKGAKHILVPAFFEGGRYTFNDIHYVQEAGNFIPASETPFAKDATFGYETSNLKNWIVEKTKGAVAMESIASISLNMLRNSSKEQITSLLEQTNSSHYVANATSAADLEALALACLKPKEKLIFRTAASFVNAIAGIKTRPPLTKSELVGESSEMGALTVIGSYVPKTTQQLNYLKENSDAVFLELDVTQVLEADNFQEEMNLLCKKVDEFIGTGKNVVLYTSRTLVAGVTKKESLDIVNRVSNGLISIVKRLENRPKYILAKGGITSSDIATKALDVKRANVLGQIVKGVPVWQLGDEAKFPQLSYIVFPGNVGDDKALYNVIKALT